MSNDDDDVGELYAEYRKCRALKRASNRHESAQILAAAGIQYQSNNAGAHLIVSSVKGTFDFWPGTGLWRMRGSTQSRRGVQSLISFLQGKS